MSKKIKTEDVKSLVKTLFETFDKLQKLKDNAKSELSSIDKELSNHYHKIEGSEINYMSDSHMIIMKLKDILYNRRDAKLNLTVLESIVTALEGPMSKSDKRYQEIIKRHDDLIQEIIDRSEE